MFLASVALFFVFFYGPFVRPAADSDVPFVSVFIRAFNESDRDTERDGFNNPELSVNSTDDSVLTNDYINMDVADVGVVKYAV